MGNLGQSRPARQISVVICGTHRSFAPSLICSSPYHTTHRKLGSLPLFPAPPSCITIPLFSLWLGALTCLRYRTHAFPPVSSVTFLSTIFSFPRYTVSGYVYFSLVPRLWSIRNCCARLETNLIITSRSVYTKHFSPPFSPFFEFLVHTSRIRNRGQGEYQSGIIHCVHYI